MQVFLCINIIQFGRLTIFFGLLVKRVFDRIYVHVSKCSQRKILPKLNCGFLQLVVKILSHFIVRLCAANLILLS